ncbi:MAG: hypothetical protein ACYTDW_02375 [Planctomycetota bacterium]
MKLNAISIEIVEIRNREVKKKVDESGCLAYSIAYQRNEFDGSENVLKPV